DQIGRERGRAARARGTAQLERTAPAARAAAAVVAAGLVRAARDARGTAGAVADRAVARRGVDRLLRRARAREEERHTRDPHVAILSRSATLEHRCCAAQAHLVTAFCLRPCQGAWPLYLYAEATRLFCVSRRMHR